MPAPLRDNPQWPHHDLVRKLDRLKSFVFDFLSDTGLRHNRNTRPDLDDPFNGFDIVYLHDVLHLDTMPAENPNPEPDG